MDDTEQTRDPDGELSNMAKSITAPHLNSEGFEEGVIIQIPLGEIVPSRHQNRGFPSKPDEGMLSLAESIRAKGVIQAIVVREVDNDYDPGPKWFTEPMRGMDNFPDDGQPQIKWEIVCGECRWRASVIVGLETIPATPRVLSDAEAAEITVIENTERTDLRPLEEARGVQTLLDLHNNDPEVVANRLGRGVKPAWVARRARLLSLSKSWLASADTRDSAVFLWAASQLEVVARLPESSQESLYETLKYRLPINPTVVDLQKTVNRELHQLKGATWDLDDPDVLTDRPACSECPERTNANKNQELLFAELTSEADKHQCLNTDCWDRKSAAALAVAIDKLPDDGLRVNTELYYGSGGPPEGSVPILQIARLTKGKGGVKCIYVDGHEAGKTFYGTHIKPGAVTDADGKAVDPKPATMEERREGLDRRRWKRTAAQVQYLLYPKAPTPAKDADEDWQQPPEMSLEKIPDLPILCWLAASVGTTLKLAGPQSEWNRWTVEAEGLSSCSSIADEEIKEIRGDDEHMADCWARYDLYSTDEQHDNNVRRDLWRQISPVLAGRCAYWSSHPLGRLKSELRRACDLIDDDLDARFKAVCVSIPEPDRWSKLKEDGTPKTVPKTRKKRTKKEGQ